MQLRPIIFAMILWFALISCQNGSNKKDEPKPKNNIDIPAENQKKEKLRPDSRRDESIQKPLENELQKKKLKAYDTLKPITTVP